MKRVIGLCSVCCTMLVIVSLHGCGTPNSPAPPSPPKTNATLPTVPDAISVSEARKWAKQTRVVIVDVRSAEKFNAMHIPNAISFPMSDNIDAPLTDFMQKYSPSTPLLVYCDNDNCTLATDFAMRLINQCGFKDVRYLMGGFDDWKEDGAKPIGE